MVAGAIFYFENGQNTTSCLLETLAVFMSHLEDSPVKNDRKMNIRGLK